MDVPKVIRRTNINVVSQPSVGTKVPMKTHEETIKTDITAEARGENPEYEA